MLLMLVKMVVRVMMTMMLRNGLRAVEVARLWDLSTGSDGEQGASAGAAGIPAVQVVSLPPVRIPAGSSHDGSSSSSSREQQQQQQQTEHSRHHQTALGHKWQSCIGRNTHAQLARVNRTTTQWRTAAPFQPHTDFNWCWPSMRCCRTMAAAH